ncbi:MAG: hypothetical protein WBW06_16850, partial [Xanthobacteraceae bacterium]
GEVLAVAAIAKAGVDRTGGAGGAAVEDGRSAKVDGASGKVDGVNGGAARRTSLPLLVIAAGGGTDAVEVTGAGGTASIIGPGAVLSAALLFGFAGLSDLCAVSADFSDLAAAFAGLSDLCASDLCASDFCASDLCVSALCAGFADLSGLLSVVAAGCGVVLASEGGAA